MIKISSFSILDGFSRKTWEFYDEYLTIKVKSLTFDYEDNVEYDKISVIRNRTVKRLGWISVPFFAFAILGIMDLALSYFHLINPTIVMIEKVIGVFFLLLLIPAFRKHEYYSFQDAGKKYLATVEVGKNNKNEMLAAIQLIKQKTVLISEAYLTDPLPNPLPVFQVTEFDFPDFLNKVDIGFYEDKLIGRQKSLAEEVIALINYHEFSGKTKTARTGNDNWNTASCYWMYFVCIVCISIAIFFPEQIRGNVRYLWLFWGGLFLSIPISSLKYIKKEIMIFYDKNDNGIFWLDVNPTNREEINQVVSFVHERVALKK
jgi:hypothetical protein